jgi:hypothetical protein
MSNTIKTMVIPFKVNLDRDEVKDKEEYFAMINRLREEVGRGTSMGGDGFKKPWWTEPTEIELETDWLFNNQWNTKCGKRVYDWCEETVPNRSMKRGYYLVITEEMREVRRNTLKCGYCGKHEPAAKGYTFCHKCLSSEYLKEKDLKMLRLRPCDSPHTYRSPELTDAETARLLPLYKEQQLFGLHERGIARTKKMRDQIESKLINGCLKLQEEYERFTWLMDNGISVDNVIYYDHTKKTSFGWREPLSPKRTEEVLDIIDAFPWSWYVKGKDDDGTVRTWSGNANVQ